MSELHKSDLIRYSGIDRHGTPRGGYTDRSPEHVAEEKHRQGWRSLVINDGATGHQLGGIAEAAAGGLAWWAEADASESCPSKSVSS